MVLNMLTREGRFMVPWKAKTVFCEGVLMKPVMKLATAGVWRVPPAPWVKRRSGWLCAMADAFLALWRQWIGVLGGLGMEYSCWMIEGSWLSFTRGSILRPLFSFRA